MGIKDSLTKSFWILKEYSKDISNTGFIRANEIANKKLTENKEEIIKKQQGLNLSFFTDSNEQNLYKELSYLLFPCNVGYHFKNGTQAIQEFIQNTENPILDETYNLIKNQIIKINFYINENNLYYLKIEEIEKIKIDKSKYPFHLELLQDLDRIYTSIFPSLQKIEAILSLASMKDENITDLSREIIYNEIVKIQNSLTLFSKNL